MNFSFLITWGYCLRKGTLNGIPYLLILGMLYLGGTLFVSYSNDDVDLERSIRMKFVEIPTYTTVRDDIADVLFQNSEDIKMFIYLNMIQKYGKNSKEIRLMQEPDYHLYAEKIHMVWVDKNIKLGNTHFPDLLVKNCKNRSCNDKLDYSMSYMINNKVCCIIIADFALSKNEILDINVVYFRGSLDAGGGFYRFKKLGDSWRFIGYALTWIS